MESSLKRRETLTGTWDDEHVKALLHFPRFPARLIQQEPWQSWIGQRGGLKAVLAYLQAYPLSPSHRRILDVVLSNPEAVADVYADRLNISRATYFYQLRELVCALAQALNHWELWPPLRLNHTRILYPFPSPAWSVRKPVCRSCHTCSPERCPPVDPAGPGRYRQDPPGLEMAHRLDGEACFVDLSWLPIHQMLLQRSLKPWE